MYDKESDKLQEKIWLEGTGKAIDMPIDKMAKLVAFGFYGCAEDCLSRKYCTDESCECIRSVFPSPAHYTLYLKLRTYRLSAQLLANIKGTDNE